MNSDNPLHEPIPISEGDYQHLTGTLHYPSEVLSSGTKLVTVPGPVYGSIRRKKARKPQGKAPRLPRAARKAAGRV